MHGNIFSVSQTKLQRYGQAFLSVIERHLAGD